MNTYKFLIILFHLPSILNYQTDQYSLFIGGSYLGMTNSKVYSIESTSEYNNGYSITISLRGEFESDNLISFGMHLGYELTNFSFTEVPTGTVIAGQSQASSSTINAEFGGLWFPFKTVSIKGGVRVLSFDIDISQIGFGIGAPFIGIDWWM